MGQAQHTDTPRRLGDFELLRELGRGGMGVVYEARQVSLNRKVALKVLSGSLGLSSKAVQRFRREAEAAAKLHHTNIVPVYATGEEEDAHFYAMELIEGPSLDHVIRQMSASAHSPERVEPAKAVPEQPATVELGATGPYAPEAAIGRGATSVSSSSLGSGSQYYDTVARLIAEVADALEYAHGEGVIHRDIKPSNLLVSPAGRFSLTDFGLARMLEQPGMTMTGEFVGTPSYMSPEQITAGRAPLNHRTDIYSLGATLYELLTFQRPFAGERRDEVIAQIMHKEPKAPRKLNAKVPVDLETICLKCMEKDPDRRYQTAGAMAEDLRRYVNRFAISARRAGPVQRLLKWAKRHPAVTVSLGIVFLAVCTSLGFAYQAHRTEQQRQLEQQAADERLRDEQDRARKQLLEEKIRNAYLIATGGDLNATDTAITEIERLGASPGQVHLMRGVVAYFRQDVEGAIRELEQAAELLPDSVAARSLLAISYTDNIQFEQFEQVMHEIQQLTPSTPEDFLFKGYARNMREPGFGLADVNEGIQRRDSPLGRALRTVVRTNKPADSGKVEDAEEALADADVAMAMRPNNPMVLYASLHARLIAAYIFQDEGLHEKRKEVLAKAAQEVKALQPFLGLTNVDYVLWNYFEIIGDQAGALEVSLRSLEQSRNSNAAFNSAISLYRQGKVAEALKCLDQRRQSELTGDMTRVFLMAETADDLSPMLAAYDKISKKYPQQNWELRFRSYLLLFLGKKREAFEILRKFRKPSLYSREWNEFYEAMRKFGTGEISEADYLSGTGSSRWKQSYAHFEVALVHLADGDRAGAKEHFEKAVQTRAIWHFQWSWSLMFQSRMEKDRAWPKWIAPKKDQPKP